MDLPNAISLLAVGLGALLVGGFAGSAVRALMARRQVHRVARLAERLASSPVPVEPAEFRGIADPLLRAALERLARRVGETWMLATVDLLTGVANRQAVLTHLAGEIERAARYGRQLSVVLIDIDHFKRLNDTFGHAAGDLVLHDVARLLKRSVRAVDFVGRYGGEEFMLILPETDVDAAASIAEQLRRLVGRLEIPIEDGTVLQVTLSAGVAGGLGQHLRLDALIRDADAALYSAKALGRDQVYVFHEVEDDGLVARASISPQARAHAFEVGRLAMAAAARSLAETLEARPGWAGRPSEMIAGTATALGGALGLPEAEIERIRTASLLHDLGKLAIPDEILSKPGELDEPEWRVVAEHPKIGQVVLEQAGALRDAATIVLHHHEWYDGRGYPLGLAGRDIPIGARIVAVADAYEAMVAGRPYRGAVTHEAAIAELRRQAGVQFDPEIVDLFVTLFRDGVPWAPGTAQGHGHPHEPLHPRPQAASRAPGDVHDGLHERRRRVAAGLDQEALAAGDAPAMLPTGTDG